MFDLRPRNRMRLHRLGRAILVSSLFVFLATATAFGDVRQDFARETGLDIDLVNYVQVDVGGTELTILFVYINDRALSSRISPSLREALGPYVGRNAVYVNPSVKSVVSWFDFSPFRISIEPATGDAVRPDASSWMEITPGFFDGAFEVNPSGADQGSGSQGILVLGDAVDPTQPFDVIYQGERARFDLQSSSPSGSIGETPSTSHSPISVPALEDVSSLQDLLELEEFSAESMAALLGLDPALVRTMDVEMRGGSLRLVFVRLEESVRDSLLGEELLSRLEPVIGTGAVMVWAYSPTGASFSPWTFYVQQGGTNYVFFSGASFVELTEGFLRTERIDAGELVAGVIRLPRGVDPAAPFSLFYSSVGVDYP
jgi:hypothetical protein